MIQIRPIKDSEVDDAKKVILTVAHELFKGADTLEESIAKYSAQGKLRDMEDIQKNYFNNRGIFLVTIDHDRVIGTGAIKYLEEDACELKRMWLLSEYHGQGVGYRMMQELFSVAQNKGYKIMRLETDPVFQQRAVGFYKKLGFYEIPRFGDDPDDIGMEMIL
jgi:putative acetyltransferase